MLRRDVIYLFIYIFHYISLYFYTRLQEHNSIPFTFHTLCSHLLFALWSQRSFMLCKAANVPMSFSWTDFRACWDPANFAGTPTYQGWLPPSDITSRAAVAAYTSPMVPAESADFHCHEGLGICTAKLWELE